MIAGQQPVWNELAAHGWVTPVSKTRRKAVMVDVETAPRERAAGVPGSQAQPYLSGSRAAASAAALVNDLYADLCHAHPGRSYTFAALPLPHVGESLAEFTRNADSPAVVGVTLGTNAAGRQLDDPVFEPVFAELDQRGYPYCSEQEFRHHLGYLGDSGLNPDELPHVKGGTAAALLLPGHPAAANQEFPAAYA